MITVRTEVASSLFSDDIDSDLVARGTDFEYHTCDNEFSIFRGKTSGLCFLSPRPTSDHLSTIYPDDYEPYRFDKFPPLLRIARDSVQRGKVKVVARLAPQGAQILDV